MRHLRKVLSTLLVVVSISCINAQDANNPWEIDFGANAVVFYPMASLSNPSLKNYAASFVNVRKHYNYYGLPVKLHFGRYIDKGFSIGVAFSTNKIRKMGGPVNNLSFFGFDTDLRYDLNGLLGNLNIINNVVIDPYAITGIGYSKVGSGQIGSLNLGGGINFWTGKSKNFGFQFQSMGKLNIKGSIHSYFQHSFGLVFKFGDVDTDKDGIYDSKDKCPNNAGLEEFNGCPDSDADGIQDSEDSCPNVAGLKELNGCPDSDGDGITDKKDFCPNTAGTKANKGCPDTDGDGVIDKYDSCPNIAGAKENKGCSWPDTDGDGILDKDDKCADTVGFASNNGCPKKAIPADAQLQVVNYAKAIIFVSNHSSFKPGVAAKLDMIVTFMNKYDKVKFRIEGYTDSKGSKKYNEWLSKRRAKVVMKYLVEHGISADRLTAIGFGEESPIDTNDTSKGRSNNRRVEIKIVNKK
ncbi:MAG: OmpA family protein [Flavobacteriaceae bacterium]|nr:OmpA family protein [Flavobacteriaceae bacterium]